jgi:hypothetical protein
MSFNQVPQVLDMYLMTSWSTMSVLRHNANGNWSGAFLEPKEYWAEIWLGGSHYLSTTTGTFPNNSMHDVWGPYCS